MVESEFPDEKSSSPTESTPTATTDVLGAADLGAVLSAEISDLKDRHLRLQAEFENFRKRKAREADEIRQFAALSLLDSIIPVLDHLELALDPTHDRTDAHWGRGIDLIARQLAEILRGAGLEEVAAGRGIRFQHDIHEAVASERSSEIAPGCIVRSIRKGYKLRDRLVRPAQVVVSADTISEIPPESAPAAFGDDSVA